MRKEWYDPEIRGLHDKSITVSSNEWLPIDASVWVQTTLIIQFPIQCIIKTVWPCNLWEIRECREGDGSTWHSWILYQFDRIVCNWPIVRDRSALSTQHNDWLIRIDWTVQWQVLLLVYWRATRNYRSESTRGIARILLRIKCSCLQGILNNYSSARHSTPVSDNCHALLAVVARFAQWMEGKKNALRFNSETNHDTFDCVKYNASPANRAPSENIQIRYESPP